MSFLSGLELLSEEELAKHILLVRHLTVPNLLRYHGSQRVFDLAREANRILGSVSKTVHAGLRAAIDKLDSSTSWSPRALAQQVGVDYQNISSLPRITLMEMYCKELGYRANRSAGLRRLYRRTDTIAQRVVGEASKAFPDIGRLRHSASTLDDTEDLLLSRVLGTVNDLILKELPGSQRTDVNVIEKASLEGVARLTAMEKGILSDLLGLDRLSSSVWREMLRNGALVAGAGILLTVFGASVNPWLLALLLGSALLKPVENASIQFDRNLFGIEILVLRMAHERPQNPLQTRVILPQLLSEVQFFANDAIESGRFFVRS